MTVVALFRFGFRISRVSPFSDSDNGRVSRSPFKLLVSISFRVRYPSLRESRLLSEPASEALSEFSSLISPLGDLDLDLGDLDLGDLDLDGLDLGLRKTGFGRLKREFLRPRGLAETLGSCSALALPFSSPS